MPPEPAAPAVPAERALLPRGIVFDLDGTLIDSRRDIASAVNRMRAERDLPPLPVEEVGAMVGEGARTLVRRALAPRPAPGPAADAGKDDLREALASYLAHYAEVCLETTRPYPGIAPMLATLAPSFGLAVLSNKGERVSRHILQALGLDRYLREVVGGDTLPTRKPNPGGLYLLADRMALPAARLLLVGDSWIDAQTAHAGGCPFALALWGVSASLPASASDEAAAVLPPPRWQLAHPHDLPAVLGLPEDGENGEAEVGGADPAHGSA